MSKLEQKLIELGYENVYASVYFYSLYRENKSFKTQQDIDNLQQAFNEMQKDLEVLRDVKD